MSTGQGCENGLAHVIRAVTSMADKVLKYSTVKRSIVGRIRSQEYAMNARIPSEAELAEMHRVSRITIRKAIDDLVSDGLLYRVQGKGTFVRNDEVSHDLFSLASCTQEIESMGMTATRRVIRAEVVPADQRLAARLQIDEGSRVFVLERVYYADGHPLNYTISNLPLEWMPGLDEHDFSTESLYDVIENRYGVIIKNAHRTVEACLADGEPAAELEVAGG
ncbi:MAG: GntR family transcriptional regulator, partial [Propionibacteriaceae bacterium]|nr:GntR family transcriptional regulator [Propionibacteriaceae bacterium]